jgi:restriction endonuclease S subunit
MTETENLIPELGSLDNFIKHFPVFASAPDGIIKLRELIIERAVNGHFFHIDEGYWTKGVLENFISLEYGKNLPAKARNDEGGIPVYGSNGIVGCHDEFLISEPAIVVGRKGSAGALNIAEDAFWPTDVTYYVVPPKNIDLMFCYYWLRSLNLDELGQGIKPGLSRKQAYALEVKLPPLEEQKRIVTKVDELMALVDKLEAQQQAQANTVLQANAAAINALLNPSEGEKFDDSWNRIANHFNTLYGCTLPMPKGEGRQKKHLVGLENIKTLRRVILNLAVSGRLTAQNLNELSARDYAENQKIKEQLVADKIIKKNKCSSEISKEEIPFQLPNNWLWTRIGIVTSYGNAKKADYSDVDQDTWVLELEDIEKESSNVLKRISANGRMFKSSKNKFAKGDVLYGKLRPYLDKVLVADREGVCTTEIIPLNGFSNIDPRFLRWVMKSSFFIEYADNSTHGMGMPRMGTDKALAALFPFAPFEEQKRIVAKVDELMAICDKLEEQLTEAYSDAQTLMQATVKFLVA